MSVFVPNLNFAEEMTEQADPAGLAAAVEPAKTLAEAAARDAGAPWMPRSGHDVVEVEVADDGVYLVNTDYAGHLQEYGSIRNPPHAPLRRGAEAAGLRVED